MYKIVRTYLSLVCVNDSIYSGLRHFESLDNEGDWACFRPSEGFLQEQARRLRYNSASDSGGWAMRRWIVVLLLTMVSAVTASAAKKDTGTTTLKDVQPAGTTDTKEKKKQQYDFVFEASGNHYTCRTSPKTSVKAVDFVVGSDVKYEVDGEKGKLKTMAGKQVQCTVVRIEKISGPKQ